jgi:hypothetical protein
VQGHIAVVVELADRDPQPRFVVHDRDRIGLEVTEFTDAHPGSGQQLDTEAAEQGRLVGDGTHELGEVPVVEELRQRLVAFGDVSEEDRHPCWGIVPAPLDDADEEHAQDRHAPPERRLLERSPWCPGLGVLPKFERLDVGSVDVGSTTQRRVMIDQEPGKDPKIGLS